MLSVKSFIVQSRLVRDSYLYGIGSLGYHIAGYPSIKILLNLSPQCVENNVTSKKLYCTIWSRSWFVFVRYRVLSGIIWQVTRQWGCCSIHHRSASKTMLSVKSFIVQSGLGPNSYLYGIGFSRVSCSRLPVNGDLFQFITAARRKQCYQ